MKTVLCYGDSNTWGFMPKIDKPKVIAANRFPWGVRWTSLLQEKLGADYRIIEAGLNGRTTAFDCPMEDHRNGLADIDVSLLMNAPIDLVIIMLGTNDTKITFNMSPYVIGHGIERLIAKIKGAGHGPHGIDPEILVVAPIRLGETVDQSWLRYEFDKTSLERDKQLAGFYKEAADEAGAHFLDAGAEITADPADCIHMNEEGHAKMAELLYKEIKDILG